MRKVLTVVSSFFIMLCIGSVYAWSMVAAELVAKYHFLVFQSQLIFGVLIAVFPATMIFAGKLGKRIKHRYFGYLSGILFFSGYFLAGLSNGNFFILLAGVGVLGGMATGFGYWVALTTPVQWFPRKKGMVAGITAAGFGLGAVFMSEIAEIILGRGYSVLQLFRFIGIGYGLVIVVMSAFIRQAKPVHDNADSPVTVSGFIASGMFIKLSAGIFLGSFAGLLIIGNLRLIGGVHNIQEHVLVLGVAFFALANFAGRISWGVFSDHFGAGLGIFLALLLQAVSIISFAVFDLSGAAYFILGLLAGFGFGGNFVLFARETAQVFGVHNFGSVYPYIFMGYAFAGITGPIIGGMLYDISGSFSSGIILAGVISLAGSLLFLNETGRNRKTNNV